MTETTPDHRHGGPSEPTTCPTCGTPAVLRSGYLENPAENWKPIGLDSLERVVVEAALEEHRIRYAVPSEIRAMGKTRPELLFEVKERGLVAIRAVLAARAAVTEPKNA